MNVNRFAVVVIAAICQLVLCHSIIGFAEGGSGHKAEAQITKIILQRVYLDGDVCEEVVVEKKMTPKQLKEKYRLWQFVDQKGEQLVFRLAVDDISPLLKTNGYFGITPEGILTIYDGKPKNSKIIHSFYQIDLGKLESRKKQQLKNGIPIKTKHRYHEVLETFKPYSKNGS